MRETAGETETAGVMIVIAIGATGTMILDEGVTEEKILTNAEEAGNVIVDQPAYVTANVS